MISIDESIDKFNKANETRPSLPEPPRPDNSVAFNVPPCDMPTFNGDFKSWPSFRDLFKAIYGNNTRLSEVEKLFYLKQKTSGEAKEIVDDAPLTNEGFLIAWTQLVSQYENKRMQINAQLQTLFNLPSVSTMCSASIRKLQRKINCCIANLNSLEIDTYNWDPIFIYLCLTKLPRETRREFERTLHDCGEMPSWTDLDLFLTNTFKELISVDDLPDNSSNPNTYPKPKHFQKGNTFHNLIYGTDDTHSKHKPQYEQQFSNSTRKYPNSQNITNGSISVSHLTERCGSTFTCRYCSGPHNTLLHIPNSNPNPDIDDNQQSTSTNAIQSFSTQTRSSEHTLDNRSKLLGTAVIHVDYQGKIYPARALIDPASDFSFISERLQQNLRLPTKHITAEISGLNEVVSARSNEMCAVTLRSNTQKRFSLEIQAIVIKTVTKTLPTQNINPNIINNIKNVQLADPSFYESRPIDLIIGSDFYPQIIKSGVKNNVLNTLLAQDTKFGWILTGSIEETHHTRTQPKTQRVISYFSSLTLNESSTQRTTEPVEEFKCKDIFTQTTQDIPDVRYHVDLPFRISNFEFSNSRHKERVKYLRNAKNHAVNPPYNTLQEYVDQDHKPTQFNKASSSTNLNDLPNNAVATPDRFMTNFSFNALSETLYPSPTLKNEYLTELNKGCTPADRNVI
ncbi:uncharacterized protein LOC135950445 [Calliphora vicina]|uniref:uncharacterized protein LOC135950445 n=1 Tax=Calliphora vicina TaxID=7373 RepID=UPI00325C1633